jgi:shikimate dehydrogenase
MSGTLEYRDGALWGASAERAEWPRLVLFGDPVAHSLSPRMHDAALAAAKQEGSYGAVRVRPADLAAAAAAAFDAGVVGINLTLPHKTAIVRVAVRASEEVTRIGAANTLIRLKNGWSAHNTDARGFGLALQRFVGRALDEVLRDVRVIGGGGAARAVAAAVRSISNSGRVRFLVRRPEAILWGSEFEASVEALDGATLEGASLVVQATPLGLSAHDPSPMPDAVFPRECVIIDLSYAPQASQFLRDARAAGCRCEGGGRMLVAQGALAFTMWFGGRSPLEVMARAIDLDW